MQWITGIKQWNLKEITIIFVFGFVNFENKHENSKSVLLSDNMVILGLQLQTEPKSADDYRGPLFWITLR